MERGAQDLVHEVMTRWDISQDPNVRPEILTEVILSTAACPL